MKKIVALVAVLFSVVVPVHSQATPGEKVVIIDSYFDTSKISGPVELVCLALDKCVNKAISKKDSGEDASNHGTLMASIARNQNQTATLVLIQTEEVSVNKKTGATSVTVLNGGDFAKALAWVAGNKTGVVSVSFSYNLTGNVTASNQCPLSTSGAINVKATDASIRSLVLGLKSTNIPVYAAAGNSINKPVIYPACIPDVVSVGSMIGKYTGYYSDQVGVDVAVNLTTKNNDGILSTAPWFGSVQFTTSAATAAIAANLGNKIPSARMVTVSSS